jgi:hypothetical protein
MSKVNVVLPDGRTVSVDEETAQQAEGEHVHQETSGEADYRRERERRAEVYGDSPVSAGFVGAADALTLGGFGKVAGAFGAGKVIQGLAEENPGAYGAGQLGTFALPLLGGVGRAVADASGLGLAKGVGNSWGLVGGKVVGRVVEGGVLGAGAHVASSNVTGDPLTIEGVMEGVGVGSLLNVGAGAVADKLTSMGGKVQRFADETADVKTKIDMVREGRALFAKDVPSWQPFVDAVESKAASRRELFDAAEKATKDYSKFVSGPKLKSAITQTENTINSISRYWRDESIPETLLNTEGQTLTPVAGSEARKPVVSDDMKAALKDWRDRLRKTDMLTTGGFDVDRSQIAGRWVKADVAPDPGRAMEELRALRDELSRGRKLPTGEVIGPFPRAVRMSKWGELPETPPPAGSVQPPDKVDLPDTLLAFAKKRPETIQRLSAMVEGNPAAQEAFQKVADELGMSTDDGVAGLHQSLGKYIKANQELVELASKAEADADKGGMLSLLRGAAKKFVAYGTARAADSALGGGWLGAAGRVLAGEGVKAGMSKVEDTLIGGALLNGKVKVEKKIAELVAKWLPRAGKATESLGDVTTWLSQHPMTGDVDKEKDQRKQAINRVNDIIGMSMNAPDTSFTALQPLMGHPSDAGWKMHNFTLNAVNHLLQTAPKDPGMAAHMFGSDWTPSWQDTIALAHRLEAVADPLKAIARALSGDTHPAATDTLWAVWPALMTEASHQMSLAATKMKGLTYERASGPSQLMRAPLTGLQEPSVIVALQGLYLPKPQQPQSGGSAGSRRSVGRPAAVQSPVAGSNVQNLIA